MNADEKLKAIRKVYESEFKDILGPEQFAVFHSDVTFLSDIFARLFVQMISVHAKKQRGQLPCPQMKGGMDEI